MDKLYAIIALAMLSVCSPAAWAVPVAQREFDLVLKRTPDPKNGASIYETCAACHGPKGEGVSDGTVPALAGQSFNVIAKQLVDFRAGARLDPRMTHFTSTRHLAYSQHIADVAAYIASLPVPQPKPSGEGKLEARGTAVYARNCERCHGASGEGNEASLAPRLANQHPAYLMRQLDDATEGRRPAMAETHAKLLRALSPAEIAAVTAYLAPASSEPGERIYTESCAACHGASARGDGPVSPLLNVKVPDLTRIAARRKGTFPELEIYRIVDGQAQLRAHGDRHMPVWGYEFFGDDADDELAHARATAKIEALVAYLRSIQRSD